MLNTTDNYKTNFLMVEYLTIVTYSFDESNMTSRGSKERSDLFKVTGRRHVNEIYLGI